MSYFYVVAGGEVGVYQYEDEKPKEPFGFAAGVKKAEQKEE